MVKVIETRQIIPDENLFGQSNTGIHKSSVVIQLSTTPSIMQMQQSKPDYVNHMHVHDVNARIRVDSRSSSNINKVENKIELEEHARQEGERQTGAQNHTSTPGDNYSEYAQKIAMKISLQDGGDANHDLDLIQDIMINQ